MLFAFSSCDAVLNSLSTDEENNQNKTEQKDDKKDPSNTGDEESNGNEGGTETKVPTSLADFVGTVYLVDSYMYYFFKDANTIITCTDWGNDRYGDIEEKEIGKDGTFCDSGLDCKIKVADGKLIMYRSERWEAEKADDTEGLYGNWEWKDEGAENPNPKSYVVTETTISIYGEEKPYTLKDGLLIGSDNEPIAYYDGTHLSVGFFRNLTKVTDSAKLKKIKKAILGDDYVEEGEDSGEGNGGEGGEETKVPTSLADFVGTSLVYSEDPDWYYNYYMYVKDADTIVTCSKNNETGKYWISEDKVQEDGSFWSDALTLSFKIKVVAGKLILYRSNVYYEKDTYADVKKDETEGLYGTWEFEDAAAEHPYPKTYVITKETFSYDECGYEDYDEKNATTKSYTLDDGLLISDGEVFAYYDGTSLYTIGVLELKKVAEETLAEEIKKHAIDPDKDDDEEEEDPEPYIPDNPEEPVEPEEPEEQLYKGEETEDSVLAKDAGYFEISSVEDFDTIRRVICDGTNIIKTNLGYNVEATKANYKIMNDIDVTGKWNKLNVYGKDFEGVIDGQGHTIKGLTGYLFHDTKNKPIVKDLILEDYVFYTNYGDNSPLGLQFHGYAIGVQVIGTKPYGTSWNNNFPILTRNGTTVGCIYTYPDTVVLTDKSNEVATVDGNTSATAEKVAALNTEIIEWNTGKQTTDILYCNWHFEIADGKYVLVSGAPAQN